MQKKDFDEAIREVAALLNHKRRIKTDHDDEDEWITDPASTLKYYVDPRIVVAWCMKNGVPVERVYSRSLLLRFRWAIDEVDRAENRDYAF